MSDLLKNMRARMSRPGRGCCSSICGWTHPYAAARSTARVGRISGYLGEGQAYGEDEADEWLAQTGWRKLERRPLAGPGSVIIAEAA